MPVAFVNGSGTNDATNGTTETLTPGAGSNYQVAFGYQGGTDAYTTTFGGDTMTPLLSLINEPAGLFNRSTRTFGLAGDYTGAPRDVVFSAGQRYRHVLCFSGVDQTSPTIGSGVTNRAGGAGSISVTVTSVDNPTGSRIVWYVAGVGSWPGAGSINVGTVHFEPDDFGSRTTASGSVAGNGSNQTITYTLPSGTTDLVMFAIVLREAAGGGAGPPPNTMRFSVPLG